MMASDNPRYQHDFHESYYDHCCAIVEEKDVLQTEIPDNSCSDRLRRWWRGLFLLSYTDKRSRIFYTSSHAIRMERLRQFRRFKSRIHPLSKFRNFWDSLMFVLFSLNKVVFHHNTSIIFGHFSRSFYYIAAVIELVIIADIFINMATGFIDNVNRIIILDRHRGLLNYGSTKLFLHVASAIPLQWIMFLRHGWDFDCDLCKVNRFISVLKIINTVGVYRVFEYSSFMNRDGINFKLTHFVRYLRITLLGFITMLEFIELCDMLSFMNMISNEKVIENSFIALMLQTKFANRSPPSSYNFFVFDISRIFKSVLLFSFSLTKGKCYSDMLISLLSYILANIFYLWTIIECYNFISKLQYNSDRLISLKQSINNMVTCRQLSDKVTKKVNNYLNFNQARMRMIERQNGLFIHLPKVLKTEIFLSKYFRSIARIPCFKEWSSDIIEGIVVLLKEEIHMNNDMVAEPWVSSEGLCVVAVGELVVFAGGTQETGHLIDGDYFGELSLVTDNEMRSSSVVALTPCVILLLGKSDFRLFMRQHPDLFIAMKQKLIHKFA